MEIFNLLELNIYELILVFSVIFIASIVRGFTGFGFSALTISTLSFILPPIQIVPIILILEVSLSILMLPVIIKSIQWKFVFLFFTGILFGSPIGLYILRNTSYEISHLIIATSVIILSLLLFRGFTNKKLNNNFFKVLTGFVSGICNGIGTIGGLPVAIYLLVISMQSASVRASLAALFFFTDTYAFTISYYTGIVNEVVFYRALPLIFILPIGVYIGNRYFKKSKENEFRKIVLQLLILISFIAILKVVIL